VRVQRNREIFYLSRNEYAQLECDILAVEVDHIFLLEEYKYLREVSEDQLDRWGQLIVFVVFGVDLLFECGRLDLDVKQLGLLLESLHAVEGVLLGYLSHFEL
jgi:hypothetical protein